MSVAELIEELKKFPPDADVISTAPFQALHFNGYTDAKPHWAKVRRYRKGYGWVLHPQGRMKVAI